MSTMHERDLEIATDQRIERFPKGWPRDLIGPEQWLEVTEPRLYEAGHYTVRIDAGKLEATLERKS